MKMKNTKTMANSRWPKGTSGNPAGRPVGSRNKSTVLMQELINGEAEALVHKAIEVALKGDTTALRLCLDRICPPQKERVIDLPLLQITDSQDVSAALNAIIAAVGEARITPSEAESLVRILDARTRIVDFDDLARRVSTLEAGWRSGPDRVVQDSGETATLDWVSRTYRNRAPEPAADTERKSEKSIQDGSGNE
jgi:hypothetical protein